MGLKEYLKLGVSLTRNDIQLVTDSNGSGSIDLGSVYLLYKVKTDTDCRLRLYDNSSSLEDATEQARAFGNTNVADKIALITDISMTAGEYSIDPIVYGVSATPDTRLTYYRIDDALSPPTLEFKRYLLENSLISTGSRTILPAIQKDLSPTQLVSGSVVQTSIPKTYLFVSASVQNATGPIRVRLYNVQSGINDITEKNRPFTTEASTSALLIDAILTGSETTYFVPKIIGANLQNMGTNLDLIRNSIAKVAGKSEMYYIIENLKTSGPSDAVTASFHVFSLED